MSYDESYENARPITPQMGDAELLLNDVIDIIVNAPNMPLSSTPRIDRDQIRAGRDEVRVAGCSGARPDIRARRRPRVDRRDSAHKRRSRRLASVLAPLGASRERLPTTV